MMPNPLFNKFGTNNISSQIMQIKNNPGTILDILFQKGKITQQQYNDLQPYKNDPEAIVKYLINNGKSYEINQAEQLAQGVRRN